MLAFTSDAVGRDLVGLDGKKRLTLADRFAFVDVNLFDRSPSRNEDLGGSLGRREIADRGLLARSIERRTGNDDRSATNPPRTRP